MRALRRAGSILAWGLPDAEERRLLSGPGMGVMRMNRPFDGWKRLSATSGPTPGAVSFVHRLTASPAFSDAVPGGHGAGRRGGSLSRRPGTGGIRALCRGRPALAYATESMRLTTRLMQVASWLLLQRAVNEGELTRNQALTERHRVKLTRQELACAPDIFEQLPRDPARPQPPLAAHPGARHPPRPVPRQRPRARGVCLRQRGRRPGRAAPRGVFGQRSRI